MIGRRRVLQLLGLAPVASTIAAKEAMESAQSALAGVTTLGSPPAGLLPETPSPDQTRKIALRRVLASAELRDEYESLIYERHRRIDYLDPDLANKRSFSLAAKIAFQRQRNVAREIRSELDDTVWARIHDLMRKAAGLGLPLP